MKKTLAAVQSILDALTLAGDMDVQCLRVVLKSGTEPYTETVVEVDQEGRVSLTLIERSSSVTFSSDSTEETVMDFLKAIGVNLADLSGLDLQGLNASTLKFLLKAYLWLKEGKRDLNPLTAVGDAALTDRFGPRWEKKKNLLAVLDNLRSGRRGNFLRWSNVLKVFLPNAAPPPEDTTEGGGSSATPQGSTRGSVVEEVRRFLTPVKREGSAGVGIRRLLTPREEEEKLGATPVKRILTGGGLATSVIKREEKK